jgi:hypothetical protein
MAYCVAHTGRPRATAPALDRNTHVQECRRVVYLALILAVVLLRRLWYVLVEESMIFFCFKLVLVRAALRSTSSL